MTCRMNDSWPVLTHYDRDHLRRIALPLGGIGTGTISLGGRGDLRDWEIADKPAKGACSLNKNAFFALYARVGEAPAVARALEGLIDDVDYEGASGCPVPNHGLPRFRECSFHAAYPFGQVLLSDPDVPVDVRLEAFNPLVPADPDASGIPVVVLRYVLQNKTGETVTAGVCGFSPHFLDAGSTNAAAVMRGDGVQGVQMSVEGGDDQAAQWGTVALATTAADATFRTGWLQWGWGSALLDFWDDFSADGRLEEREGTSCAAVAAETTIPPHGSRAVTFLITWRLPNRISWTPVPEDEQDTIPCCCKESCGDPNNVGNYYATQYADAWDAAVKTAARLEALEAKTVQFVRSFCDTNLPAVVKEAALFNLSTLRSQTCFRTADGRFYGWEGCNDGGGCCHGSCTHVWNYEQATAFLFGSLSRAMREVEFSHATLDNGLMCFRTALPLWRATAWPVAAADGQMGCLMKLYRDWQLSGDDAMLRALWPQAKKTLEFCWIPGGWDADQDGVMEGCQHNTMDVEYFGPNPQMGAWYLGALRACEEMAAYLGDDDFAARCRDLFLRGKTWLDAYLFNGEFYEHEIRPPMRQENIAPGLQANMGAKNLEEPDFQLGKACLVDQLVGQYMAKVCGLGYLLDPAHVKTTLQSIMRFNYKQLYGHFNNMRSFALQEESALLMATYPHGDRPLSPFPYFTEVMTGFEYTAAVHMLYEGLVDDGLKAMTAVRARYDGRKRSPFDEAECGHHYARAMASWAAVLAWTGFHYSAVTGVLALGPREGTFFWSNGDAWGTYRLQGGQVSLTVHHGTLSMRSLRVTGIGQVAWDTPQVLEEGETLPVVIA